MTPVRQDLDDIELRPGYALKRASVALHRAMEEAVAPHGLTVAQYACLELLARRPGASPAELARGAFVSRQAAHQVVGRLLDAGLVARSPHATLGQRHQLHLTREGERRRRAAERSVLALEGALVDSLPRRGGAELASDLRAITDALEGAADARAGPRAG